jgi:hypothetical protein
MDFLWWEMNIIPSIGVKLHRALTLNIFTRVTGTANPTNYLGVLYNRVSLKRPQQGYNMGMNVINIILLGSILLV